MNAPTFDLSALGGPAAIDAAGLTAMAARAKTKVQASRHGWERLTPAEIVALAWFADLWLEDATLPPHPAPKPVPQVISTV